MFIILPPISSQSNLSFFLSQTHLYLYFFYSEMRNENLCSGACLGAKKIRNTRNMKRKKSSIDFCWIIDCIECMRSKIESMLLCFFVWVCLQDVEKYKVGVENNINNMNDASEKRREKIKLKLIYFHDESRIVLLRLNVILIWDSQKNSK
jgi:uncharacterized protein YqjF (DUF2071 family)